MFGSSRRTTTDRFGPTWPLPLLLAPTALQLVHLLVADLVWLGAVLLAAAQLAASVEPARTGPAAGAGAPVAFAGR